MSAFVDSWHKDTYSFHLSIEEMTMTLNDVTCMLHLHIKGRLLDHDVPLFKDETVDFIVELSGYDMVEA